MHFRVRAPSIKRDLGRTGGGPAPWRRRSRSASRCQPPAPWPTPLHDYEPQPPTNQLCFIRLVQSKVSRWFLSRRSYAGVPKVPSTNGHHGARKAQTSWSTRGHALRKNPNHARKSNCRQDNLIFRLQAQDPGSGRKIPAIWHDTGAFHVVLSQRPGTKLKTGPSWPYFLLLTWQAQATRTLDFRRKYAQNRVRSYD